MATSHQWRLQQVVDDGKITPNFPVFVKPEWGQNSYGVSLVKDLSYLQELRRNGERLPVNSIKNKDTFYIDRTAGLNENDLRTIWAMVRTIGSFRIARLGLRVDSTKELLAGNFQVIEVNVFLPMPPVLLDMNIGFREKHRFIRRSMKAVARIAKCIGFFKKKDARLSPLWSGRRSFCVLRST